MCRIAQCVTEIHLQLHYKLFTAMPVVTVSQWSFGVVLWEIMTKGRTPYEDVLPDDMLAHLTSGHRLQQPKSCPDDL